MKYYLSTKCVMHLGIKEEIYNFMSFHLKSNNRKFLIKFLFQDVFKNETKYMQIGQDRNMKKHTYRNKK